MKKSTEVIMNGYLYEIDKKAELFRQSSPVLNIPFSALEARNGWYELKIKVASDSPTGKGNAGDVKIVRLPAHFITSKTPPSADYKSHFNTLSYEHNWQIQLIDDQITDRLKGKLPVVNLAGDFFKVDLEHHHLLDSENKANALPFGKMQAHFGKDGIYHSFYYDKNSRSIQTTPFAGCLDDIFQIVLPAEKVLDPIGYSRLERKPDTELLNDYRMQLHHIAQASPLAMVIEQNRNMVYNQGPEPRGRKEESVRSRGISV